MSRIEKALEKAVKLRETAGTFTSGIGLRSTEKRSAAPIFEMGKPAVDPSLVDKHIVCVTDPQSLAVEQYRKLRARVLTTTKKDDSNTLMIASSDSGEGKTVTAINLAVSIAHELDHTVLLVDADLRNPSVHKYLGIKNERGLSDYLKNKATLSDVLVKTGLGKLVLLPAGTHAENSAELISSERMQDLVREMKHRYGDRYILFDSAPVLLAADALSLCNYMDGILFVVQADHTSPKTVETALSLLKGYKIIGSVFNNVPAYLGRNMYPYYYRYGGKYTVGNSQKTDGESNEPNPGEA